MLDRRRTTSGVVSKVALASPLPPETRRPTSFARVMLKDSAAPSAASARLNRPCRHNRYGHQGQNSLQGPRPRRFRHSHLPSPQPVLDSDSPSSPPSLPPPYHGRRVTGGGLQGRLFDPPASTRTASTSRPVLWREEDRPPKSIRRAWAPGPKDVGSVLRGVPRPTSSYRKPWAGTSPGARGSAFMRGLSRGRFSGGTSSSTTRARCSTSRRPRTPSMRQSTWCFGRRGTSPSWIQGCSRAWRATSRSTAPRLKPSSPASLWCTRMTCQASWQQAFSTRCLGRCLDEPSRTGSLRSLGSGSRRQPRCSLRLSASHAKLGRVGPTDCKLGPTHAGSGLPARTLRSCRSSGTGHRGSRSSRLRGRVSRPQASPLGAGAFRSGVARSNNPGGSAAHRVYVALSTLRTLGLRDVLISTAGGYHLRSDVTVAVMDGSARARGPRKL